jgi:hypothetical protein
MVSGITSPKKFVITFGRILILQQASKSMRKCALAVAMSMENCSTAI